MILSSSSATVSEGSQSPVNMQTAPFIDLQEYDLNSVSEWFILHTKYYYI